MLRDPTPISATYFREYGMHELKNSSKDSDFIASSPDWDDTLQLLKSEFPKAGNVITPEYATLSSNIDILREESRLIDERIREAIDITRKSDAILHLGTPTETYDNRGRPKWLNSVLSIHRGKVREATHKTTLLPVEQGAGVMEPLADLRRVKDGIAVLICAELYGLFMGDRQPEALRNKKIKRVFAPTSWAIPITDHPMMRTIHEAAGGEDNYYRQQLELVIGRYVMSIPSIKQVVVADKGRADLPPYNAVFNRIEPQG